MASNHPRPGFWAHGPHLQHSSSGIIILQRDVDSGRSGYAPMFLRSYFLRILGLSSFPNWLCIAWRFICLYSTWSKRGLHALCCSPNFPSFHLILSNKCRLSILIWYKIAWNRIAQTDSNQATLDARIGRASLQFSTPPDLFGLGRNGIYFPQESATLMVCVMFELAFSHPASLLVLCPAELILHPWSELGQQDAFYTTPV